MHDDGAQLVACIPRLRRYARALVGERSLADDLVQDTLERAWSQLASWRRSSDMRPWLFGIMHNLHIDQVRRPKMATDEFTDDTPVPVAPSPGHGLELRDLASALAQLPVEQREILLLVGLEEMRYEEVAQTLRIPLGTVMSRLSRGRERLRAVMDGRPIVSPMKIVK